MASLVAAVEVPVVVEADHRPVVVAHRKGFDPAWALLADLRGEADMPPLALVAVVGVGNFHIAFA